MTVPPIIRREYMKHIGAKTIETERLILRPFCIEDAEAMYRNWASDAEVTKFLTWQPHGSVEQTAALLANWCADYAKPDYYQWAIEGKELGQPIGSISAVRVNDSTQSVEIGYCIGTAWWGQGIMPEVLRALIAFFFDEVGVECVRACHAPENPKSGRVMQKCGMHYDGTLRHTGRNNRGVCDEVWYSILKAEYHRRKSRKERTEMNLKPYHHNAKYYETDQMAVVHHSNYIRWFEEARIDWLEQMGIPYDAMEARGIIIPVIGVTAEYRSMTRFKEDVAIYPKLERYNGVRFIVSYEVRNANTGELRCTGTSTHCFIDRNYKPIILKKTAPDYDAVFRKALDAGK